MLMDNHVQDGDDGESGKQLYLIGKKRRRDKTLVEESESLEVLRKALEEDSQDARVVRCIGEDDDPLMLVVEMYSERANQLKKEHPDLIVEKDASLHLQAPDPQAPDPQAPDPQAPGL